MTQTLAFDVYGTLIDTAGVVDALRPLAGARSEELCERWRDKQLEYAFRRGLMGRYVDFPTCTREALRFVARRLGIELDADEEEGLMSAYERLPAFADAAPALAALDGGGHRLFAFSNGPRDVVERLLEQAGLREWFLDVVSVDEVHSFKPDPAVYARFLHRAQSQTETTWLISGNPFDVTGARACGWRAVWIDRAGRGLFDPWELAPSLTLRDLGGLAAALSR